MYENWWLMSQSLKKSFIRLLKNLVPRMGEGRCIQGDWYVFYGHFLNEVVMPSVLQDVEL